MPGMQPSPMDMRTLVAAYGCEHSILQALAHLYSLPRLDGRRFRCQGG
jgi:hypothetical protein